jgi:sigma-E factor negative regulatory protein RseC
MGSVIRHAGIIERIDEGCVKVRILQTSACASCKVAERCGASESKEKIVDVRCDTSSCHWAVGQPVTVTTSNGAAHMALVLGFGLPLLIMMVVLVVVLWMNYDEGTAALASLLVLVPYYLILWVLQDRISKGISFKIWS